MASCLQRVGDRVSKTTNVWRNDNLPLVAAEQRPLRILVIDEDPLLCWSIAENLVNVGDLVIVATSCASALRVLIDPEEATDFVLLEYEDDSGGELPAIERVASSARRSRLILMTSEPLVDAM